MSDWIPILMNRRKLTFCLATGVLVMVGFVIHMNPTMTSEQCALKFIVQKPSHTRSNCITAAFKYLIQPKVDNIDYDIRFVFLIVSRSSDFKQREMIRSTWANKKALRTANAFAVFIVGNPHSSKIEEQYQNEQNTYGDILFDKYCDDSYKTLSKKVLSGLYWVYQRRWKHLQYVVKMDSDSYIIISNMLKTAETMKIDKLQIVGEMFNESTEVIRDPAHRWYVPSEKYPCEWYMPYLSGATYMMNIATLKKLVCPHALTDVENDNLFIMEDYYFTGLLRLKIGIKLVHNPYFNRRLSIGPMDRRAVNIAELKYAQYNSVSKLVEKFSM